VILVSVKYTQNQKQSMRVQLVKKPDFDISTVKPILDRNGVELVEDSPDFVLSLGGDGMVLKAMKIGPPVIALNAGALGFLTQGPVKELDSKLQLIKSNDFKVVEKPFLDCFLAGQNTSALNDIYFCSAPGRALRFSFSINNTTFPKTIGDGLLVSTPSGTTGYCLSSGGPAVSPNVDGMIITLVNPHLSRIKSMVVGIEDSVSINFDKTNKEIFLSCDGTKTQKLLPTDKPTVKMSNKKAKIVMFDNNYFDRLSKIIS